MVWLKIMVGVAIFVALLAALGWGLLKLIASGDR